MDAYSVNYTSTKEFYPTYLRWCKRNKFPHLPLENLPENVFVANWLMTPIYCCFVWKTDSKMALQGFPLANKNIPYIARKPGLPLLYDFMSKLLGSMGITRVWTTSATPPIVKALEDEGYILADENVGVYIKQL